jgi:hypothetical protein
MPGDCSSSLPKRIIDDRRSIWSSQGMKIWTTKCVLTTFDKPLFFHKFKPTFFFVKFNKRYQLDTLWNVVILPLSMSNKNQALVFLFQHISISMNILD